MSLHCPKTMLGSAAPRSWFDEEMKRSNYFRHFDCRAELCERLQIAWSSCASEVKDKIKKHFSVSRGGKY